MRYDIIPNGNVFETIEANTPDNALVDFATKMDLDMNCYFSAVPEGSAEQIFTRDEAAAIVELFEDVLDKADITVPSPEDADRTPDNEAKLYGTVYSDLIDGVEERLKEILSRKTASTPVVTDIFSGTF